jgi:hypothetical protein
LTPQAAGIFPRPEKSQNWTREEDGALLRKPAPYAALSDDLGAKGTRRRLGVRRGSAVGAALAFKERAQLRGAGDHRFDLRGAPRIDEARDRASRGRNIAWKRWRERVVAVPIAVGLSKGLALRDWVPGEGYFAPSKPGCGYGIAVLSFAMGFSLECGGCSVEES